MMDTIMTEKEAEKIRKEITTELNNTIYALDEYVIEVDIYKDFVEKFYNFIKAGFEHKSFREHPVRFTFPDSQEIITLQLRHFLTNLFFWEPMVILGADDNLDASYIIEPSKLSNGYIKKYIDEKIITPFRERLSNKKMNLVIHDMLYNLSRISYDFNIILGISMNVESFIFLADRNERFREIITTRLDPTAQPKDIEDHLDALMHEEIDILKKEDTSFKPIIQVGTGIKTKQLAEFSISGGLKPDLDGNTITTPIDGNLLYGGLNSISNYFIDSNGGRKALIMSHINMGDSGYLTRKIMLSAMTVTLANKDSCNTVNPLKVIIKTPAHLKRYIGREARLSPSIGDYTTIKASDTHLIGKEIFVRSPITCACKHGVCDACYGKELAYINAGINIGAYGSAIMTNPIGQRVLSAKHLLTTVSDKITLSDDFYKYFSLNSNDIVISNDIDESISLDNYKLVINHEDIDTSENLDEGEMNSSISKFFLKNKKDKSLTEIKEIHGKAIYISPELSQAMGIGVRAKPHYEINMVDLPDDDTPLFVIEIKNNELTRSLYDIMGLFDSAKKRESLGLYDITSINQAITDLMIESDIDIRAVHYEVVLASMIRKQSDVLAHPDFSKSDAMNDCQVLTVSGSLLKNPSLLLGLSFEKTKDQLIDPLTYRKTKYSFLDPFYMPTLKVKRKKKKKKNPEGDV